MWVNTGGFVWAHMQKYSQITDRALTSDIKADLCCRYFSIWKCWLTVSDIVKHRLLDSNLVCMSVSPYCHTIALKEYNETIRDNIFSADCKFILHHSSFKHWFAARTSSLVVAVFLFLPLTDACLYRECLHILVWHVSSELDLLRDEFRIFLSKINRQLLTAVTLHTTPNFLPQALLKCFALQYELLDFYFSLQPKELNQRRKKKRNQHQHHHHHVDLLFIMPGY